MTENTSPAEKRDSPRFEMRLPLTVRVDDTQIQAFTSDVSNRGVFFYYQGDQQFSPWKRGASGSQEQNGRRDRDQDSQLHLLECQRSLVLERADAENPVVR